jgi:peptidoglycan/LPS O-acetylase OafA/YrhL
MSETTVPRRGSRLAWLDALRGFAALCVVFDHGSTLLLLPARSFLYQWLNLGQYGVFVFFLVSGYIVPASLERKGSVRGFWISRAFRLYPMFIVALAASYVAYITGHGEIANAGRHPLSALLGWVFMLQNVSAGINVPDTIWTLSYEMVFYLLLAGLFAWGVHKRSGWFATGFAVVAVAVGGILPMAYFGSWSRYGGAHQLPLNATVDILVFVGLALAVTTRSWLGKAGTTVAALVALVLVMFNQTYPYPWSGSVILALMFTGTVIYRAEQKQLNRWAAMGITILVLALTTFAGTWHGASYGTHWELQWATSVLLAGATFGIALAVRNLRIPRFFAWLGMVSYSVYLIHPMIFDAYRTIPVLHHKHTMTGQVLLFLAILAVVVALSAVTYYGVEKPMQRLGRRVAARFPEPVPAAAPNPVAAVEPAEQAETEPAPAAERAAP